MFGEAPLRDEAVAAALRNGWSMPVAALDYRRIGYGSYHWLATTEETPGCDGPGRRDRTRFGRHDELVDATVAGGIDFVVTHGEPHAGNVVHAKSGPMLIDWDTARWAPRERDLWSLVDHEGFREGYGDIPLRQKSSRSSGCSGTSPRSPTLLSLW